MNTPESTVNRFPCPSCGASLEFNPKASKLKCGYCGWEDAIPETAETVVERSYEEYLQEEKVSLITLSTTALEVRCNDCGASVTFEPPKVAGQCPFCASPIVTQPTKANPTVQPEGVIPFQLDAKAARSSIQKWLSSRWFAPSSLKALAQQEKIQGVYLPFWTYDASTVSRYTGQRGEYYYVTETYTETNEKGETETKTREVRHTRWWPASGAVNRFFDDVLIPATQSVARSRLDALEPWHLKESLQPYHPSFLAGFEAQRAQVTLSQGFEDAKKVMASVIHSDVCRDIGGDEQRVYNISTDYSEITFKHIFLPVWLCAYRYQNKRYQVMVNARTGEVQGERPYSIWKITGAVVGGLVVIGFIIALFNLDQIRFPHKPQPIPKSAVPEVPVAASVPSPPATPSGNLPPAPVPIKNLPQAPVPKTISNDSFRQAVNLATKAANAAQEAETEDDWEKVASQWQQAINQMKQVPPEDPNYPKAQKKITEYQKNWDYAQKAASPEN